MFAVSYHRKVNVKDSSSSVWGEQQRFSGAVLVATESSRALLWLSTGCSGWGRGDASRGGGAVGGAVGGAGSRSWPRW